MTIWLDPQLSPQLATWITEQYGISTSAVRDFGLVGAKDTAIFDQARAAAVVVMTKDRDFVDLVARLGPPPQIIWVTCGNTSNAKLKAVLSKSLSAAIKLIDQGEPLVEIGDAP